MRVSLAGIGAVVFATSFAAGQSCPRWNTDIGQDGISGQVYSLLVHDEGHGPALFAGGGFVEADGHVCFGIARWDGAEWSPVGYGVNGIVYAMAEYDDGGGPALYAAGDFTMAGDSLALRIARWDGDVWTALGKPGDGLGGGAVRSLLVFDGALYAGGEFNSAAGIQTQHFAKWDGSKWSGVDGGFPQFNAMAVFDDGNGPRVYIHGSRDSLTGLYRLSGGEWEPVVFDDMNNIRAMLAWNRGDGERLFVGSDSGLYSWAGQWEAITPTPDKWTGRISALAIHDDGTGPALYAGGMFSQWEGGGPVQQQVARWDGQKWGGVGDGVTGAEVKALASGNTGGGPAIFLGGDFQRAGCNDPMFDSRHIAEWSCPAGCYADFNRDTALDLFDFLAFVNSFNAPTGAADCNRDCSLDLFDFLCFTNAFNAGCP